MNDVIAYLWLAVFLVVNPLLVCIISRGRRPTFMGKAYMLATLTMFSLFFFGMYYGKFILSLIAVGYLLLMPIVVRRITSFPKKT
jgi:hypothetical protein